MFCSKNIIVLLYSIIFVPSVSGRVMNHHEPRHVWVWHWWRPCPLCHCWWSFVARGAWTRSWWRTEGEGIEETHGKKYPEIRKEILKDIVYKKCAWFWLIWYRMVFDMLHALGILCALWHLFHRFKHALDLWHVLVTQAVWVPWEHFEDWNWNPDFFIFFLLQTNWKRDMGWFGYGLYSLSLNFHSLLRSRLWILTRSAFEMWTFVELLFYIYFRRCQAASRCWCCKQDALFLLVDFIGILLAFHRDSYRFDPEF